MKLSTSLEKNFITRFNYTFCLNLFCKRGKLDEIRQLSVVKPRQQATANKGTQLVNNYLKFVISSHFQLAIAVECCPIS